MTDKTPGVNSWFMANHMATQSQSLNKAAKLQALGVKGKYLLTKAERRRINDRKKHERKCLTV